MLFHKQHIMYLIYRALSISFIAIGINHIILDVNILKALLFLGVGFVFTVLNIRKPSVEERMQCLKNVKPFFKEFLLLATLISFSITVLSLYRQLIDESFSIGLLTLATAMFFALSFLYIYLCKRSR